jgi:hypothetical protein
MAALLPKGRPPPVMPTATPPDQVEAVLAEAVARPTLGARQRSAASSTVAHALCGHGGTPIMTTPRVDLSPQPVLRKRRYRPETPLPEPAFEALTRAADLMTRQIQIPRSAEDRIDSLLSPNTGTLQAELFDDELAAASALLRHGHLRAAGALSGIVIERHLARTVENPDIKLRKSPTIVKADSASRGY